MIDYTGTFGSGFPAAPLVAHLASKPMVQRLPDRKLTLFVRRDFLDPEMCAALVDRIDANRVPSAVGDAAASYRTSETCAFDRDDPVVCELDRRLAEFTQLHPAHGEPLQGARYDKGQFFGPHTDYFEPFGPAWQRFCQVAGQRTWTVMIYLDEPEAGGATRFKAIDKTIRPERGKLLAWDNLLTDGMPNPDTLHHAMPVRAGIKHVVTKWYRERPWG